jgi:hypothetical protein
MASRDIPLAVFLSFSIDALGVLPTDEDMQACHIWIALDDLSRFVICAPTRQITSESLATFLIQHIHIFLVHGTLKCLHLDNATNNRSNLFGSDRNIGTSFQFMEALITTQLKHM